MGETADSGGPPAPLAITLLGTGSPLPDPNRAGPATLVSGAGEHHLVDAGRGVLMRLAAAAVAPGMLTSVLLTHLHSDHTTDLGDVITTRWVLGFPAEPLVIVGPVGTGEFIDRLMASLSIDIGYRLAHHEDLVEGPPVRVVEVTDGEVEVPGTIAVTCAPTDHRPVAPTVAYRFDLDGASVVTAGDTVPCEGLDRLCLDAGALVHTVLRKDVIEPMPIQRFRDTCDYHSSPEEAARTAARAGVRILVFTHYVPAPPPGSAQDWIDLARPHFAGRIEAGDDLHRVEVSPR
ncbi:MAG: ribonuclease Z [Acidimicrobiales bacterium]|nr:ribonuclease Z [Acidimicrobiales bacterium]